MQGLTLIETLSQDWMLQLFIVALLMLLFFHRKIARFLDVGSRESLRTYATVLAVDPVPQQSLGLRLGPLFSWSEPETTYRVTLHIRGYDRRVTTRVDSRVGRRLTKGEQIMVWSRQGRYSGILYLAPISL